LPERLEALNEVAELAADRVDDEVVDRAREVVARAGQRLRLSGEHTVVALAGATGSGKSSLFNALAGLELSPVGVRRPTTATPYACVWEPEGAGPLLEWLGIPRRHQVARETVLDADRQADLHGLVLLDLPDHDSTELDHRLEVDRLVELVDLLVWVVDPQKYADAALHERYLRSLSEHSAVVVVVLNQVDTLSPAQADECAEDLARLLAQDRLGRVPVLRTSARTGEGLAPLRAVIAGSVQRREAFAARVSADVTKVAGELSTAIGGAQPAPIARRERKQLLVALEEAAGVPAVVDAVDASYRSEAIKATGWPVTRWVRHLRPDPLRRLHLGRAGKSIGRTSLPEPAPVVRAQVDAGVRRVVEAAAVGLPTGWADAVRGAARSSDTDLADALDVAVAGADLGTSRRPGWWRLFWLLQWVLAVLAVVGLLWLAALFVFDYLQLPEPDSPSVGALPLPTVLLLGGVLAGLLLAGVSRLFARVGARRRAQRVTRRLRERIGAVAAAEIFAPLDAELDRYRRAQLALGRARS
jgi:GTP-binding protein EngB required for normal cell division